MKTIFRSFVLLVCIVILSPGCASIVTKSTYPLLIQSEPSDASVVITNQRGMELARGKTPYTVMLKAGDGFFTKAMYSVKFSKEGYEDRVLPVTFSLDGWYFGNILFGGLIGMLIIDPATGAMWRIDQDILSTELFPKHASLKILDVNDLTPEMKEKMIPIEVSSEK